MSSKETEVLDVEGVVERQQLSTGRRHPSAETACSADPVLDEQTTDSGDTQFWPDRVLAEVCSRNLLESLKCSSKTLQQVLIFSRLKESI